MIREYLRGVTFLALVAGLFAFVANAGTPPPPYTGDPATATVNGLGGIGNTDGNVVHLSSATAIDALNLSTGMVASAAVQLSDPAVQTKIRTLIVKRVWDDGTANVGVCVRLGPNTNAPTLNGACPAANGASGYSGGCYLANTGDSCSFQVRPILTGVCTATGASPCLPKLWINESSAADVAVAVMWAW